jgi:outer membrane protein TolC
MSDFDETLKTITFEVQDAFLNYQKALLGLNTAENEIKFRRSQMEVIKIRALVGEASLSATMEALYTLGESQTKYLQALSSYQISLVNLKKATGYGLKI